MESPKRLSGWTLTSDGFLGAVLVLLCMLVLFYSGHMWFDHDEFEHIHSAWYVANGYTPYADFFQNHHPLLWYCLAPILLLLGYSTQTVVVLRMAFFALTMGIASLTFLIARRVTSSTRASLLSVLLLLSMVMFVEKSVEIRPDVPQVLLGLASVYFFVGFIQTCKSRHVVLAGVCASFSFLFLQKTAFLLIAYALILCYGLARRRITLRSVVYFVVAFSLPAAFFLGYLLLAGSYRDYLLTNWLANTRSFDTLSPLQYLSRPFFAWIALFWVLAFIAVTLFLLSRKTTRRIKAATIVGAVSLFSLPLLAYLLTTGSLMNYILSNWLVNTRWLETFSPLRNLSVSFLTQNTVFWLLAAASVAFALLNRKTDQALKAIAFMGIILLLSVLITRIPHRQYYMFAIPLLCITAGHLLDRTMARFGLHGSYAWLLVIIVLIQPLFFLVPRSVRSGLRDKQLAKIDFVIDNSTTSDLVYDGDIQFNLYRPDLHYFWYSVAPGKGLDSYNAVTNDRYGDYDICQLVRSQQPKFISNHLLRLGRCGLRPFYDDTPFPGLYVRNELEGVRGLLWRNLGDYVALMGYEVNQTAEAGEGLLHLALWWQSMASMTRDYTLFIHVVAHDGQIWAQQDTLLRSGRRPTSLWRPGETVKAQYDVTLPAGALPDAYTIKIGLYHWETGERLSVWDERGQRVADDTIPLHWESDAGK